MPAPKIVSAVPSLPGYNLVLNESNDKHRRHALDYCNGYPVAKIFLDGTDIVAGDKYFLDGKASDPSAVVASLKSNPILRFGNRAGSFKRVDASNLLYSANTNETEKQVGSHQKLFIPAHVAYDKIVLTFDAYFKQTLPDGNQCPAPGGQMSPQQYLVRRVHIRYYVEDDSIDVIEPPVENSGLAQGVLIRRQLLPKPTELCSGSDIEYYTIKDFDLGKNVTFYGKTFRVVGCNKFTERFIRESLKLPLAQNPVEAIPEDPYLKARHELKASKTVSHASNGNEAIAAAQRSDRLKRFLENDRKVLRFYGLWDDRESLYGEVRDFILHYFLVDDSIEVREVQKPNCGRDPSSVLLRRSQLPKAARALTDLGTSNIVFGTPKKTAESGDKFYTWKDFRVGSVINVLGRPFLLHACDEFTRRFYEEHLHFKPADFAPLPVREVYDPPVEYVKHEDLDNPQVDISVKKREFMKAMENEGKVLRFVAHLESNRKEDATRRFVVSFCLSNDTISIYEPPVRNTGILGGKFMERTRIVHPQRDGYYQPADLFVGATLEVFSHKFVLTNADEFVFKWMEERPAEFPQSNVANILAKVKNQNSAERAAQAFQRAHKESPSGILERQAYLKCARELWGTINGLGVLNDHEILALGRYFEVDVYGKKAKHVDYEALLKNL